MEEDRRPEIADTGFTVEKLEALLIEEAERRGDRLYRIILTPQEASFFPRQRVCLDVARMESAFNVIRVCPEPDGIAELPSRLVFFISTMMPFERAALLAAERLSGSVDIAEIPFESWEEESARWKDERGEQAFRSREQGKGDVALLILSYKILRFDMNRILEAIGAKADESQAAKRSLSGFESRLLSSHSARLPCLVYRSEGELALVPRFAVRGFFMNGDRRIPAFSYDQDTGRDPEILPDESGSSRFGIIVGGKEGAFEGVLEADRLVAYREIPLGELSITGRISHNRFLAVSEGAKMEIYVPEYSS